MDKYEFQSFSSDLLQEMFSDGQFKDVTLASDDGQQIAAHKVVLSLSSSIMKAILANQTKDHNPIIFCRGVKFEELQAMLEFIYFGKTSMTKSSVKRFLDIAEDFGVRGIVREDDIESQKKETPQSPIITSIETVKENCDEEHKFESLNSILDTSAAMVTLSEEIKTKIEAVEVDNEEFLKKTANEAQMELETFESKAEKKTEELLGSAKKSSPSSRKRPSKKKETSDASPQSKQKAPTKQKAKVEEETTNKSPSFKTRTSPRRPRKEISTESSKKDLKIEQVSKSASPVALKENFKIKEEQKTKDDIVKKGSKKEDTPEYKSGEITIKEENFYGHMNETVIDPNLSKLGKFQLEDGKYKCDNCEYKSEQKKHVFVHKLTVHVKLKFECDVCENLFTDPRSLKKHKVSSHEDIRYECDLCERTTSTAYHLASHKRRKHTA